MMMSLKQRKIKLKPRIKLKDNIHIIEYIELSTLFVVSHILSAKVSPGWRLNLAHGTLPLNRGVPSIGNRYKYNVNIFSGPNFVSLNRSVPKERFHCIK